MIVVEHNKIELDYCHACEGVWFDSGELELLLESINLENTLDFLNDILDSPEARSAEKKRKCPICNQKMRKVNINQDAELLIDACQRGEGLWFDGGEMNHLISLLTKASVGISGSQQQVTRFLGEVFKVQEQASNIDSDNKTISS